jgi:O-methyltransferase involved in polyketide biosynthesis
MTPVDVTKPNIARMYDYWLGGKDNFEADRAAAEAVRAQRPNIADQALDNKKFQTRAVSYAAGQGVAQFLDIGSGLPTSPVRAEGAEPLWLATHEAARAVIPDAILADPAIRAAGFTPAQPACVILACILHFLDAPTARGVVHRLVEALAPGSFVAISVGYAPGHAGDDFARTYNAQDGPRIFSHSWDQVTALFDGLELVPPGLVDAATWQAGQAPPDPPAGQASMILAGLGRKP